MTPALLALGLLAYGLVGSYIAGWFDEPGWDLPVGLFWPISLPVMLVCWAVERVFYLGQRHGRRG